MSDPAPNPFRVHVLYPRQAPSLAQMAEEASAAITRDLADLPPEFHAELKRALAAQAAFQRLLRALKAKLARPPGDCATYS